MFEHRAELRPAHRLIDVLGVHQPADGGAEHHVREVEQHQGEEEVRRGEPEEADQGQAVVPPTVLVGGGVDPDGKGDDPGEHDGREREQEGQEQPIPDHLADREVVFERVAEVPLQHPQHPGRVLLRHRAVQAVLPAQELDLLLRHPLAGGLQLGDVGREVVALGKLDDGEHQRADDHQGGDHHEDAPDGVLQHGRFGPRAVSPRTRTCRGGRCRSGRRGPSCRSPSRGRCAAGRPPPPAAAPRRRCRW